MGTKRMGFCAGALACALVAAPILVSTGMGRVATTASAASTPSASVTGFSVTPGTTGPGAFDLAVKDLPSSAFAPSSGATDTPVAAIGVGHTGVGHTGVGHTGVGHTGVGHTALNFLGVGHTGVGHTGVGHTDVVDAAFGSMLIADLTIAYPHGCALTGSTTQCTNWDGIRAGTPLQDLPPQSVSLRDIINDATAFARFSTLTLDDIDISNTPLNDLPIAAVALANVPLSHLVIDPLHTDRVGTLKAWCAALAALPTGSNIDCKNDVNADPATFTTSNIDTFDDITLMTIALGGADFSQLPLDSIVVTGNPNNPSAGQVLAGSPLGGALVGTNNIADPNNPTTNLFEPDVTLADIGVGHTDLGDTGVGHTGVGHTGVGHTGVGHTDINALGVGHTGVGHTDLDAAGVGHTGVGHTGVGHTGVGHTGVGVAGPGAVTLGQMTLNANGLGGILLSHLDLTTAGLDGILLSDLTDPTPIVVCGDGTGATVVCATATLGQAAAAGALQPRATLLALQAALTPASTSLASFNAIKSGILISAIPPTAAEYDSVTFAGYISEIPQGLLDTSPYQMTLADFFAQADQFGVFWSLTSDIDASVTSIVVKGTDTPPAAPFDTFIGGELVHVTAVDNSAAPTRTFTVVRGVNGSTAAPHVAGTPVFAGVDVELGVLLQGISVTDQNRTSLQELFDNLPADILAKTDLADLLSAISAQTHVTLDDLLLALIGQLDLPWEQVNLGAVQLQTSDTTNPVTLKATAALSVTDDGNGSLQNVDVVATIPADYAYSPLSAMLGATALAEPAVGGGTNGITLTWSLRAVPASTPSLTFKVQPGLVFGTETLSAEAHLTGGTAGTSKSADVTVNNSGAAASTNPGSPTSITPDTLYLGHLTPQATSNFYSITVTGGERVSLLLGNLPGDYDLILYDAAGAVTHLRGTPDGSVLPISDPPPSLTPAEDALPPEPLQDLAIVPGLPVHEVAQHRGVTDEEIDTGTLPAGTYLVQVAGYDGANSGLPYSLRARVITDPAASCPASVTPYSATPSVAYTGQASATPPATADTVVLWDPARFENTWGTAALSSLYTSMNHFMSTYGKAVLVDVESDSATKSAYTAWDNNRCNVDLANAVVQAIGRQIDTVLGANAGIKYLTMIGADDQIPMARVRDATRVANERGRSGDFGDANQIAAAMGGRWLLTDDVYTQQHPLAVGGRDLYTPELAIGRLVDEPVEIQKALDDFANAQGHLPSSAKSLVTGYDFLSDGANDVANALAGNHGPVDSLINPTWTADDLATALLTPDAQNRVPGIASLNAHFDEQNILPAAGNSDKSNSELLTFLDVKRRGTTTSLQGALLFGMGCHGGLELPDSLAGAMGRSVSQTGDWTQLMAQQGAVWIANTGYGYGDTDVNALSEQLMTLLADQLDRSTTIGDALRVAKQRYRAGLSVLSAYDEKVMQEATFYGFPMWSLGAPTQDPVVLPTAGGISNAVDVAGLKVAQFSHTYDPSAAGSFNPNPDTNVPQPAGYYDVNDQTLVSPQRPIQPRDITNVTMSPADQAANPGYEARGALITALSSQDVTGFLPTYSEPQLDISANQHAAPVGDAAFPAGLQSVSVAGPSQYVNVVPAQFRPTPGLATPGRGTERLFTSYTARVYYAPSTSEQIPPTIFNADSSVFNNTVTITARVLDNGGPGGANSAADVKRVVALATENGNGGIWYSFDLTPSQSGTDPAGTFVGQFSGLPIANGGVDFYLQAIDGFGNVASTASKGAYFNSSNLTSGPLFFDFSGTAAGSLGSNGWYRGPVNVTIRPPAVTATRRISYSIDGGPTVTAPFAGPVAVPTISDTNEGVHTITAWQAGQRISRTQVLIDRRAPAAIIGSTGAQPSDHGWFKDDPHTVTFVPLDPGTFGSGVDKITYSATGAATITPPVTVNEPPVGSPPASVNLDKEGITTLTVSAQDRAGNPVILATRFGIGVDSVAPTVSAAAVPTANANSWHNSVPTVTITANDAQHSSGVTQIVYTVNGQSPATPPAAGTPIDAIPGAANPGPSQLQAIVDSGLFVEGTNVLRYEALDEAGNQSGVASVNVNIDLTPPTVSCASPDGLWHGANIQLTCHGADVPSGLASPNVDGTFQVGTSLGIGNENANVSTDPRAAVFDLAGNSTAVPQVAGNKIDLKSPTVNLSFVTPSNTASANPVVGPSATDTQSNTAPTLVGGHVLTTTTGSNAAIPVFLLGQTATVSRSCTDSGSGMVGGLASCTGQNDGAGANTTTLDTSTVKMHTYVATGIDAVGNKFVRTYQYRVVYNLCLNYNPTTAKNIGSTISIQLKLCKSNGTVVSVAGVTLTGIAANNGTSTFTPNQAGNKTANFFVNGPGWFEYDLKTDNTYKKTPLMNWLNVRITSDPYIPASGSLTDQAYLNKLYRAYFQLK